MHGWEEQRAPRPEKDKSRHPHIHTYVMYHIAFACGEMGGDDGKKRQR